MKCQCGSNASKDVTSGNIVCTRCGIVFEEAELVSDLQYVNTIVQGNFISEGSSGMPFTRTKHGTPIIDSSQIRLSKAYKEIKRIASSLGIIYSYSSNLVTYSRSSEEVL
jgi:transcription initiation factor TFIIIB Brf1 subunit/transcription initiation factor TFIIB